MKRNLLLLFPVLMLMLTTYAQYDKSFTGYYKSSGSSILLLEEDHSFYITAYATFIQGNWVRENNVIKLVPHNPEHTFELYARFNPNIKEGYKVMFNGFEKQQTFMGVRSADTMQAVFNPKPNCFNNPYIAQFPVKSELISFVDSVGGPDYSARKTYSFTTGKYNDFIAVYNDPTKYHREIILPLEQQAGEWVLKSSVNRYDKHKPNDKVQQEIDEIREFAKKEIGILYQYEKITPANIAFKQFKINGKSLFTAKCSDQE